MIMTDFSQNYDMTKAYDEMFDINGVVRESYQEVFNVFKSMGMNEFDSRGELRDKTFIDQGITFSYSGEERPWPLDLIPRIITSNEWSTIEAGLFQRVKALEMFLEDVYTDQNVIEDGIVPRKIINSSNHFHRQVHGFSPTNNVRIHIAGIDLIRDITGEFRVLDFLITGISGKQDNFSSISLSI